MIQNRGIDTLDLEVMEALTERGFEERRVRDVTFDDEDVSIRELFLKCLQRSIVGVAADNQLVLFRQIQEVGCGGISDTRRRAYAASGLLTGMMLGCLSYL